MGDKSNNTANACNHPDEDGFGQPLEREVEIEHVQRMKKHYGKPKAVVYPNNVYDRPPYGFWE